MLAASQLPISHVPVRKECQAMLVRSPSEELEEFLSLAQNSKQGYGQNSHSSKHASHCKDATHKQENQKHGCARSYENTDIIMCKCFCAFWHTCLDAKGSA